MDFENLIKTRRSIRHFTGQKIKPSLIKKIIELGTYAPSACNFQAWHFIVIDQPHTKDKIVDLGGSVVIKNAPVGILVLYDKRTKNTQYQDYLLSAATCIENMLLAVHHLNLGASVICHLPPKKQLNNLLNIDKHLDPVAYLLIGYPQYQTKEVPRKYQLENQISYNQFKSKSTDKANPEKLLGLKKALLKLYHISPLWLKKILLNKLLDKTIVRKFKN